MGAQKPRGIQSPQRRIRLRFLRLFSVVGQMIGVRQEDVSHTDLRHKSVVGDERSACFRSFRFQWLTSNKRSTCDNFFQPAAHPQLPGEGILVCLESPSYRRAKCTPYPGPESRMILRYFSQLVVEQKELQHLPQLLQFFTLQPRQSVSAKWEFSPLLQ